MAQEAAQRACAAIEEYLQAEPSLKLDVVRGGFILRGIDDLFTAPGAADVADALGEHGVGELYFLAPPPVEDLLALVEAAQSTPSDLIERGGMQVVLAEAGATTIRVVPVVLTKIETPPEIPEDEADRFLAELAADAARLTVWLRSLLSADDEGLAEGILTLQRASGDVKAFGRTMAAAFLELDSNDKDRLIESSITLEPIREVSVEMLANLSSVELTAAIRGGRYGQNLMSISYALTAVPYGDRTPELLGEIEEALRAADVSDDAIEFLEKMIVLRCASGPEPDLPAVHPEYVSMLEASRLAPDQIDRARRSVVSRQRLDLAGVTTLVELLDLAPEIDSYSDVLGSLARSVPHLLEAGDTEVALAVVRELSGLAESSKKPWPGLSDRFAQAMQEACGQRSMMAVLGSAAPRESALESARELVALGGEAAAAALAHASIESDAEGSLDFAEEVLGRRLSDFLVSRAGGVDPRHVAKLAELFARDGGPRAMQALGQLVARPEDQVRSRTLRGIIEAGGNAVGVFVPKLLRDPTQSIAVLGVQALAANIDPQSLAMLADRLAEIQGEDDLPLGREIIAVLAASDSPDAEAALQEVAERGSFIRKGRHAEMKRLAREALESFQPGEVT